MPREQWAGLSAGSTIEFSITNNNNVPIGVVTQYDSPDNSLDTKWVGDNNGGPKKLVSGVSLLASIITFLGDGDIEYEAILKGTPNKTYTKTISGKKGDLSLVRVVMEVN